MNAFDYGPGSSCAWRGRLGTGHWTSAHEYKALSLSNAEQKKQAYWGATGGQAPAIQTLPLRATAYLPHWKAK